MIRGGRRVDSRFFFHGGIGCGDGSRLKKKREEKNEGGCGTGGWKRGIRFGCRYQMHANWKYRPSLNILNSRGVLFNNSFGKRRRIGHL